MNNEKSDKAISIKDTIRLKHELNKNITYSGLNSQQVVELEELSPDQHKGIDDSILAIKKSWWFFSDAIMWIGASIGVISFILSINKIVLAIAIIIAFYCIGQLIYRRGFIMDLGEALKMAMFWEFEKYLR